MAGSEDGLTEAVCLPDKRFVWAVQWHPESLPDAPLPFTAAYPGGRSRVIAHIEAARLSHARRFGAPPVGMWPAEGAVSEEFVRHLAEAGGFRGGGKLVV